MLKVISSSVFFEKNLMLKVISCSVFFEKKLMLQDRAADTLYASIFFASEQAKKDFRCNRCRNTKHLKITHFITF